MEAFQAGRLPGAKQKWAMYGAAIPDLRVTMDEMVAEGDGVAARWTAEGTHRGELLGIPPTGKRIRWHQQLPRNRGEVAVQFERWDRLDLIQQLGVIPARGQGTE